MGKKAVEGEETIKNIPTEIIYLNIVGRTVTG